MTVVFVWIWLMLTALGAGLSVYLLREAQDDATALRISGLNGARRLIATRNVRDEWLRLTIYALGVALGVWVLTGTPGPPVARSAGIAGVLVVIIALLTTMTALAIRDRRRLMRTVADRKEENG
ncbi:MAG: hypothetical protein GEU73_06125 [Chloroflexi bacterium]|nr:hypothetical protein [Chloroflexota bacterium]